MKIKISVLKQANYADLQAEYELPQTTPCTVRVGQVFYCCKGERPDGMCESAWATLQPFVTELLNGGGHFYGDWMKNPASALISCNDGFRPVSFLIEAVEN